MNQTLIGEYVSCEICVSTCMTFCMMYIFDLHSRIIIVCNKKFLRLHQFPCFNWSLYSVITTNFLQLLLLRLSRSSFVNHFVCDWMVLLHQFHGLEKNSASSTKFSNLALQNDLLLLFEIRLEQKYLKHLKIHKGMKNYLKVRKERW